jgi:hypothetical protein
MHEIKPKHSYKVKINALPENPILRYLCIEGETAEIPKLIALLPASEQERIKDEISQGKNALRSVMHCRGALTGDSTFYEYICYTHDDQRFELIEEAAEIESVPTPASDLHGTLKSTFVELKAQIAPSRGAAISCVSENMQNLESPCPLQLTGKPDALILMVEQIILKLAKTLKMDTVPLLARIVVDLINNANLSPAERFSLLQGVIGAPPSADIAEGFRTLFGDSFDMSNIADFMGFGRAEGDFDDDDYNEDDNGE